jgi:hypothetical protein
MINAYITVYKLINYSPLKHLSFRLLSVVFCPFPCRFMEKAYIILAHKNLDQLIRLIGVLDDGRSTFFLHIDLKTQVESYHESLLTKNNIIHIKRISTKWGGFSLAEATLTAMHAVQESGISFNAISLLSGQDYPVKSNAEIDHFLANSKYSIFLDYFPLPDYRRWNTGGTYRYEKYFFGTATIPIFFSKSLNLLSMLIPPFARKMPDHLRPYCGSQWWTMDMYALQYILRYVEKNPRYYNFHKFTFAPDELFFHTILLNAKDERIRKTITNNNLRFMKWITVENPHPEILTKEDFPQLKATDALFARKFDPAENSEILSLIDDQLNLHQQS